MTTTTTMRNVRNRGEETGEGAEGGRGDGAGNKRPRRAASTYNIKYTEPQQKLSDAVSAPPKGAKGAKGANGTPGAKGGKTAKGAKGAKGTKFAKGAGGAGRGGAGVGAGEGAIGGEMGGLVGATMMGRLVGETPKERRMEAEARWEKMHPRLTEEQKVEMRRVLLERHPFGGREEKGGVRMDTDTPEGASMAQVRQDRAIFEDLRTSFIEPEAERVCLFRKWGVSTAARPDLKAGIRMRELGLWKKDFKVEGEIPGVEIGDTFTCRNEMCVVGLHGHWLNGIDFMSNTKAGKEASKAISVVVSGGYVNDKDEGTRIIYTGEGGNDLCGDRKQIADQKMERGNLALKNNIASKTPVRVIRGHACPDSPTERLYTYCGLYQVIEMKETIDENSIGKGKRNEGGFKVFEFTLELCKGQKGLSLEQVRFVKGEKVVAPTVVNVVCKDISNNLEKNPIVVTNRHDDTPAPEFKYIVKRQNPTEDPKKKESPAAQGCGCKGECKEGSCACARLNGGSFHYIQNRLRYKVAIVVECGKMCSCSADCPNRNAQHGLRYRLEVFKTENKGWGVRTLDFIPAGASVVEYLGEVLTSVQASNPGTDTYVLDIDVVRTAIEMGKLSDLDPLLPANKGTSATMDEGQTPAWNENVVWALNGDKVGNVAKFINHSCDGNLFYQNVLWDHHKVELAHPYLFAARNIAPLTELTYDYHYELGSVTDANGNVKAMECHCGARNCRGRLY